MAKKRIYARDANPAIDPPLCYVNGTRFERELSEGKLQRINENAAVKLPAAFPAPDQNKWAKVRISPLDPVSNLSAGACEICGFARLVERCHIIPSRFGGPVAEFNILHLCPNHHSLFDRNLLTWEEIQKVWPQIYAAINVRISDPNLEQWRAALCARYGVSFDPS